MKKKQKMIFGNSVKVYEPENLRSPKSIDLPGPIFESKRVRINSLLSTDTQKDRCPPEPEDHPILIGSFDRSEKGSPISWKAEHSEQVKDKTVNLKDSLTQFYKTRNQKKQMKRSSNHTETQQSIDTKTKKISLRRTLNVQLGKGSSKAAFGFQRKKNILTISDIIKPKPAKKHQMWIKSLARNKKNLKTNLDPYLQNPYLNMSSFNISDDISHIIPSFSNKRNSQHTTPYESKFDPRRNFSNAQKESVANNSHFLKNNQSISAIEPDDSSYCLVNKKEDNSLLEDLNPTSEFQINLYQRSHSHTKNSLTLSRVINKQPDAPKGKTPQEVFNSSCNTLQYNKRLVTKKPGHKKNKPSIDKQLQSSPFGSLRGIQTSKNVQTRKRKSFNEYEIGKANSIFSKVITSINLI